MNTAPSPELQLNLVVLRSHDIDGCARFYEILGADFERHNHGNGPVHLSAEINDLVLEIYPAQNDHEDVSIPRIGFSVINVSKAMTALEEAGVAVVSPPKNSPWGIRGVVRDFDGRVVELIQQPD